MFLTFTFLHSPNFSLLVKVPVSVYKSSFVVNSLIVKRKRVALSNMLLQSLVFQKVLIQPQLIDNQRGGWKLLLKK